MRISKISGKRWTKILTLQNIRFFSGHRELNLLNRNLHTAETVSITFEFQMKDTKNDTVTHYRSGHSTLCPVIVWAKIVQQKQIRLLAAAIGKDTLGFLPADISLHSARSGTAMAMYLLGTPAYTIMLLGRWTSNAFLKYIRKQIKEFSKGVSKKC
jgi:hypothetical protein